MKIHCHIYNILLALVISAGIFVAAPALAQEVDLESFAQAAGFSTSATITVIIARLIRTAITLVGVVTVAFIIYGGFVWMTSGGDATRLKKAKDIITNAIIGLLLVFASFAITQFILNALVSATGADISGSGSGSGSYTDSGGSSVFYLSSMNTQCAEALANLQLQFVFSKNVDSDTVEEGIIILDSDNAAVEGVFSTSGSTVVFRPSTLCEGYDDVYCFVAGASYTIDVDSRVVKSTSGSSLTCTTSNPCTDSFTTGTGVDINDPTVEMDKPEEDGESLYANSIEQLQASTYDDSGVSTVNFYVIDDDKAIYSSGVDYSSAGALVGDNAENAFFTDAAKEWNTTAGYTTNKQYDIWAKGYDCAGNTDTADPVTIILRAGNCNNGEYDSDYETGSCEPGEPCDCGGDASSAYYCGACEGDECTQNSQCASGQCVDGQCVSVPKIEGVSPGDGAPGNLITISGEGFGDDNGTVTFLGTESGDEVEVSAYECNEEVQWSDDEIIIQIPNAAVDGPILVTTSTNETERTDNDYGPSIADFDVNAIARPGICLLDPNSDDYGSPVDVYGNSFGDSQGSSTFYFTNYEASSYVSWSDALLGVVVPNVNSGNYRAQVFTGDYVCVSANGDATSTTCSDDDDCETSESCATSWCSETLDYCDLDDDCGEEGGSCESIRVGSNQVAFTVKDVSSTTRPIISYIDSGWRACSDDDTHCGDDDDCGEGATCEDALNWGPPGQYITIYGTGFGTSTGSVLLKNESRGYTALGDTNFPDICGDDFWHDTYVTVKVPQTYLTDNLDTIDTGEHALTIERADGIDSDASDFVVVLDDSPGPAICNVDPSAAPAGEEVTVYGENFGTSNGIVTFYALQKARFGVWENDEISSVVVPDNAATGPVYVTESVNGYTSNSVTFNVGDCREETADFCGEGETCCENGACSEDCETIKPVAAHYAYKISTGITPNTPQVVVACTGEGASPTPWDGWSDPKDVCVNASVQAEFNMAMDSSTLNTSTVIVRKCTQRFTFVEETAKDEVCAFSGGACRDDNDCEFDDEECLGAMEGECKNWEVVEGSMSTPDETGFVWNPSAGGFETSTLYRVILQGVDQIMSKDGGYLEEDYEWEFTTSDSQASCEVGDVNVRPSVYTQTQQDFVAYSAQLTAQNDQCVALSCAGHTLYWDSQDDEVLIPTSQVINECANEVYALSETPADDPATITATVTDPQNNPSGSTELIINFFDPSIDDYFPQCSTACVNALPWGEFNTDMDWNTVNASSVTLYACLNSLCETSGLTALSSIVGSVDRDESLNRFKIKFLDGKMLNPDTWHRVVVDGDMVVSQTGVALFESGSNYGTDQNRYFEDDFSWTFKTKDDPVSCGVDSVAVDPDVAKMKYIDQRAQFDATATGAPDDCSVQGQTLQSGSYEWDAWTATDSPNNIGATSGSESLQDEIVAYMILDGAIKLTTDIPTYCTAACLNAGASVTTADGVCGNSDIEDSEECDDGGTQNGDGCSSACLNEGNDQCPATCAGSGASCTSDASCNERCTNALCSQASDSGKACALDADCDSGNCSDDLTCDDYQDAGASCSNNGACDSGYCVGVCSISGDSCSGSDADCSYATGDTCELSGSGCCGDGFIDNGEDCDDANITSGDGCSSVCLNEGSRAVNATCGDGVPDWAANTGGEDCDDGNSRSGDGCSSNCLLEGSTSKQDVYAICGDGIVDVGEDCDPGDYAAQADGCSSACLYEGSPACSSSNSPNCCGNKKIEPNAGEECEIDDEGCSDRCLWAGSSYAYSTPSFCGDGDPKGIGEECDALFSASSVGDYGVAQVAKGAVKELDTSTGYAISTITATVDGKEGGATLELACACTTDASCGQTGIGCGASNCCFKRPTIVEGKVNPAENSGDLEAGRDGYCRNTSIWLEFSSAMDKATFDKTIDTDKDGVIDQNEFAANLYLDLVSIDSNGDGLQEEIDEIVDCPTDYDGASASGSTSAGKRFWNWLKQLVLGIFGRDASASDTFACHVPVTYELVENKDGTMLVYLRYNQLLEENAVYRLVVVGDDDESDSIKDGVLSENAVTLCLGESCEEDTFVRVFEIGEDICKLDRVVVEDLGNVDAASYEDASVQYFSSIGEEHAFTATPQTYRTGSGYEEISPLTGSYEWSWAWTSSNKDGEEGDVVAAAVEEAIEDTTRSYSASGYTGREQVLSTATITTDELFETSTKGSAVTGTLEVTAIVCENPWPSLDSATLDFPYLEDDDPPSYFSFYYCRDAGEAGTQDDLPDLEDPIDVVSLKSSDIKQELIFKIKNSRDAIGVRVFANEPYLSPSAWVREQEFTGSFSKTQLDGYPAVEAGNTLYAAAANVSESIIYPNIYVVSYNDGASSEAQEIFDQILENWRFNANTDEVTDINLCQDSSDEGYVTDADGDYVACEWDGDCFESCEDETCSTVDPKDIVCDAQKGKLTRDMIRLLDVVDIATTIDVYGDANSHCSVTKGQSCEEDDDCPGIEECVAGFPTVQSGTFVPALSNSIWSSWSASLGNDLGAALATDPINEFYNCSESGYDSASCWNGEEGTFICPDNSHLYGYQSVGGEDYLLYAVLESDGGDYTWAYALDTELSDEVTVNVEYPTNYSPASVLPGFSVTPIFCDGGKWGDSALCGDGTQGALEACEIGDTMVSACTNSAGVITLACQSDCRYQSVAEAQTAGAACVPYSCGNGVVESGEVCDDGSLNGTYGHCDDLCGAGDAFYCGDGYLAGGEACDCGTTSTYTSVIADAASWATIGPGGTGTVASPWCVVSNGQYTSNIDTSCSYNCTQPGLSCGDGRTNGSEECDGDYEQWEGALCSDNLTPCTSDSDCASGQTCGSTNATAKAGTAKACIGGTKSGFKCETDKDCEGSIFSFQLLFRDGTCSANTYDLYRYRVCQSDCSWPFAWTGPVGGDQQCGNGIVEGNEQCDDGNSSNNDACLNTCVENVCGDGSVNIGVESCDSGEKNGARCSSGYGTTCTYCSVSCKYLSASGGYCGDGVVDTGEVCDGGYSTLLTYYDSGTQATYQTCDADSYGLQASDEDDVEYTCSWLGVCNGGDMNGERCTLDLSTYNSSGSVAALVSGTDAKSCGDDGECVPPVCADDCGSSCPLGYKKTGMLVKSELAGSTSSESIALYSYLNSDGDSPDNGVLYIPACNVATNITADINDTDITPPSVDLVFVTDLSGSMKRYVDSDVNAPIGQRRIDYVVEATKEAVEELFDAYENAIQISLVSFSGSIDTTDGVVRDIGLSGSSFETNMQSILDGYLVSISGGTSTYKGVEEAVNVLSASLADVKIVVLLSDGEPTYNQKYSISGSGDKCEGYVWNNYPNTQDWTETDACVAEIADNLIDGATQGIPRSDIIFFSAAVTTDDDLKGYMAHMSSNVCAWDQSSFKFSGTQYGTTSTSDCEGAYAYSASSSEEIKEMYGAIVDTVLGTSVTFTATDASGNTTTSTGVVQAGSDVGLPFPDGFICQNTQQTIPVRNVFYGNGSMLFSDFTLTYCPYE